MIDLCIDARMAHFSGIGTYLREMLPFFRKSYFRITLIVDRLGHEWARGFDQIVFNAPIYSIREQILYPLRIPSCDLFFSPHYNVPIFPIHAKKRIATVHDVCHLTFGSFFQKIYAKRMIRRALRADKVITVSEFSKKEIQKHFGNVPIEVISIGVNKTRFQKQAASEPIRKKYNLPKKFVLFVGNNKPHKNIEALKRAFTKAHLKDLELVIVGKGTVLGEVEDRELPVLYSMAEAFVFPSKYEGFGLPPLEAMSCQCPTAVSDVPSIKGVCANGSLYFDPNNEEEMASIIKKVVSDRKVRENLIDEGLKRVQLFNWEETAELHLTLFEKVCRA